MNSTNVTFVDQVSGIFGLGFPRLSTIRHLTANGMSLRQLCCNRMTLTAKLDRYAIFCQVSTGRRAGISFFWRKLGAQCVVWLSLNW